MERPTILQPNQLYLTGGWNFQDQYAGSTGSIVLQYNAKNVYLVASAGNTTAVQVLLDGMPLTGDTAGTDVKGGVVPVKDERLYTLVEGKDYGIHTLELDVKDPGLRAYTFTFG